MGVMRAFFFFLTLQPGRIRVRFADQFLQATVKNSPEERVSAHIVREYDWLNGGSDVIGGWFVFLLFFCYLTRVVCWQNWLGVRKLGAKYLFVFCYVRTCSR